MKICAIDFETANESPLSAISLGVVIYEDGEFKDSEIFYFCPPSGYRHFIFTYIHHLTFEDVKDREEFSYYIPHLKDLLKDSILVAHNARFDLNVLNALCDYYEVERFCQPYLDTVKISRRVYPTLCNHRLNTVAEYLNIELKHHEALSDSLACLLILIKSMEYVNTYEIDDFLRQIHMKASYNC